MNFRLAGAPFLSAATTASVAPPTLAVPLASDVEGARTAAPAKGSLLLPARPERSSFDEAAYRTLIHIGTGVL